MQAVPLRWSLSPTKAHGLLMTPGIMPSFFCGFLFAAGPTWLKLPPVDARSLMHCVLAQLAGWAVFMFAAHGTVVTPRRSGERGPQVAPPPP